jgi:hypothetical protein
VENGNAKPSRGLMEKMKITYPDIDINSVFFFETLKAGELSAT